MAQILVTPSELDSAAEELQDMNQNFKNAVNGLEDTEEALSAMWEGEAKEAFRTAFHSDKTQMDNFYNAIVSYVTLLQDSANRYRNAEAENVQTGTVRIYH